MAKAQVSALVLVCLFAAPSEAAWYPVGTSVNKSTWYMDPERLKVVGNKVQAWVKIDSSRDRTVQWNESKQLMSFNCAADTVRTSSVVKYDSYGKVVSSESAPDSGYDVGYEPVIPDSMAEMAERLACKALPNSQ